MVQGLLYVINKILYFDVSIYISVCLSLSDLVFALLMVYLTFSIFYYDTICDYIWSKQLNFVHVHIGLAFNSKTAFSLQKFVVGTSLHWGVE